MLFGNGSGSVAGRDGDDAMSVDGTVDRERERTREGSVLVSRHDPRQRDLLLNIRRIGSCVIGGRKNQDRLSTKEWDRLLLVVVCLLYVKVSLSGIRRRVSCVTAN